MSSELGVWKAEDCALVLIDYQPELFESIRSETDATLVELHVRLLAKAANAFDMPIVLSTIGVEADINSPTQPALAAELSGMEPIDRTSMNAFESQAFREAVEATGRKRLIIGGLVTEVCLAFAVVEALKNGYEVMFPTDAVGSRSQVAHRTAIERLSHVKTRATLARAHLLYVGRPHRRLDLCGHDLEQLPARPPPATERPVRTRGRA